LKKASTLFPTLKLGAIFLLAAVALAACGGGGGSSDGSGSTNSSSSGGGSGGSSGVPSTSTVPAAIIAPATTQVALPAASGNPTTDGVSYVNAMRQNVGLPVLATDAGLTTASLDHATYLVENQTYGHTETAGLPGYTGADPQSRIMAEGNYTATGEVVVAGAPAAFASSVTPVQTLFDAPYHRIVMLSDFKSMGVGSMANASWEAFNIDFGNEAGAMAPTAIVAYPYPGQTGVPTTWFANESPNPFANSPQYELTNVGYPVTIVSGFTGTLSSINFTITDPSGNAVACEPQTPATDPSELSTGAMCVPFSPLLPNTTYTVHVSGVLTAENQLHPINTSYVFTTGAAASSNAGVVGQPAKRELPLFGGGAGSTKLH
jgi:uncharacterized protein YkwD